MCMRHRLVIQLLFTAAQRAGWVTDAHRVDHVKFGIVKGPDGKRFKSRESSAVRLVDLLDSARDRMQAALEVSGALPCGGHAMHCWMVMWVVCVCCLLYMYRHGLQRGTAC